MTITLSDLGLPNPLFKIGDTVYTINPQRIDKVVSPCPDCLGAKKWLVKTPAGEEFTVDCHRCGGGYQKVLTRTYQEPRAYITERTIGSVEFCSYNEPGEQYKYMCRETGIGSGTVYYEKGLYPDKETAEAACALRIAKEEKEWAESPRFEHERNRRQISTYTLSNGLLAEEKEKLRKSEQKLEKLLYELDNLRYEILRPTYDWQKDISEEKIVEFLNKALEKADCELLEVCKC